ncbi:unnamed protein product [Dicrocoelium dendriticum]|nr:unnamed protein product [Dicrocoelium dendriticum]
MVDSEILDELGGPQIFNHFTKEKPVTSNQRYGFFYKDDKSIQPAVVCIPTLTSDIPTETVKQRGQTNPLFVPKQNFYVAPELKCYRRVCGIASG